MADLQVEVALKEAQARNLKDAIAIRSAVCSIKNSTLDPALERLRVAFNAAKVGEIVLDATVASAIGTPDAAAVKAVQDAWKAGAETSALLAEKIQSVSEVIL
mgnify:CR=1 FL=1